jgi:diadenosine tetraphosphate (Ap4A) HIT family hydrolase
MAVIVAMFRGEERMADHEPWMDDRIGALLRGENPTEILRMKSGYAVLGDYQYLPGYCVLLRVPPAQSLNELSMSDRAQFMRDVTLIGDAIMDACHPAKLNYAVMMNLDMALHAHIQARYAWEPDQYRKGPAWNYPAEQRTDGKRSYSTAENVALKERIRAALVKKLAEIYYWEDEPQCP